MSITYQIRKWATENKDAAQALIALSTIALFFLGHVLGVLAEMLVWDTYAMFLIGAGTAILAWTLAPRQGDDFPIRYTYARQKIAVVIVLISMTVGIGGWAIGLERLEFQAKDYRQLQHSEAAIGPGFIQSAAPGRVNQLISNWFYGGVPKRVLKGIRKLAKSEVVDLRTKKKGAFGFVIVVFISLNLAALVALLSCALACNGKVVLSVLVALGGLVIVLAFLEGNLKKLRSSPNKKRIQKIKDPLPDS